MEDLFKVKMVCKVAPSAMSLHTKRLYAVASWFTLLTTVVTIIYMSRYFGPGQYNNIRLINGTIRKQLFSNTITGTQDLQEKSIKTPMTRRKTSVSRGYVEWNPLSLWTDENILSTRISSVAQTLTLPASNITDKSAEIYVCIKYMGRLGNNLFQFASGYGIAASKSMKLVVRVTDKIHQIFQIKNSKNILISTDKHKCDNAIFRREHQSSAYDKNVVDFKPVATYRVGLYLQSWKYFHNVSHELRGILKFRSHITTKANNIKKNIFRKYNTSSKNVTLIAVHVRRGDMVTTETSYSVATKEYFEKAFQFFSSYPSPIFIVCSDDLSWSKENIPKNYTVEFMNENSPEEDLALMASCDHMISSVGSFSWWAGWFTNGTVIYYKWPVGEGSIRRKNYSLDFMDYFYPHWIGL